MGPRRRRSSSWRAAPAVGHSRRETKPGPHASSGREGPVRILANEGDGTGELPENVGFQRHSQAQLSADSKTWIEFLIEWMDDALGTDDVERRGLTEHGGCVPGACGVEDDAENR